mgnify:CR=1 FL=1
MSYLLTGASGFLGKEFLKSLNTVSSVDSLGRSDDNDIIVDLSSQVPSLEKNYIVVVHAAGKAHMVPKSSIEKDEFFKVNHKGTCNLLQALEKSETLPKSFIYISSVAVYGSTGGILLGEDTPLNATDPYGKSKIMAEESVLEWGDKCNVRIGILRLPLIAGAHPPGNLNNMLKAQLGGYYFQIGGGKARKSMVSAIDVAHIIPKLAVTGGIFNLTDQYHPSFAELAHLFSKKLKVKSPYNMPLVLAQLLATVGDIIGKVSKKDARFNSNTLSKMTNSLTFSDAKAKEVLSWQPRHVLDVFESLPEGELIYD